MCGSQDLYRQAERQIRKLTCDEEGLSAKQTQCIVKIVKSEGKQVRDNKEAERQCIAFDMTRHFREPWPEPRETDERLYISMDGIFVRSDEGKRRFRESKIGFLCTQQRETVGTKGRRRIPITAKEYVSSYESSDVFGSHLHAQALQMDWRSHQEVFVIGDGARWIRVLRQQCFRSPQYILDWYHLHQNVCRMFRKLLPEDQKLRRTYRKPVTSALWKGQKEEALQLLSVFRTDMIAKGKEPLFEERYGLDELVAYINNNAEGIVNYRQMQKDGYVIASSLAEKAADLVVAKRQKKKQGMHWSHDGADGVAAFRTVWLNEEWDEYWNQRRKAA